MAPTIVDIEVLKAQVALDSQFVDRLVSLIPPKHWFIEELTEEQMNAKYQHNKRLKAPKQEIKERTKKAKKAKLDPNNEKTVLDVQREQLKRKREDENPEKEITEAEEKADSDDDSGSDCEETASVEEQDIQPLAQSDISELRARLQAKRLALAAKRNTKSKNNKNELRENRKKKKEKSKKPSEGSQTKRRKGENGEVVQVPHQAKGSSDAKTVVESVAFGKIDFGENAKPRKGPKANDIHNQLKQAEAKKLKLEKLKEQDSEKAKTITEKQQWRSALQKAQGEKVRDDTKMLKKALKRQEKKKEKSSKQWQNRKEETAKSIEERQKKRTENIKKKVEEKKDRKKGKGSKGKVSKGKGPNKKK
ncbi:surfeit locus protein 6-domain-containing protein [Paraphysoderma sedebokerense]|nr:surfeit locus protein 6-domain-containing protein [Paraphysoderma sedebokerense]